MTHAITANARDGDFDPAAVTDHTLILDALIFTTGAFVIANWTEDALAKKTAWLRFERAIVDRLGIFDFTTRPFANGFRRGDSNADTVKLFCGFIA